MASGKRAGSSRSPGAPLGKGLLREQLRALVPRLTPERSPKLGAPEPARPKPDPTTFEQLAAGLVERARGDDAGSGPARPARAAPPASVDRAARLWVERSAGSVRARAEGVPPRLLQDLESGRYVPRRHIDLHRQSAAEARQTLDHEIARARRDGINCLLVVCGRGNHSSSEGPVLPDVAIERLSEHLAADVLAFATAPRKWGGEGALIVRLRAPKPPVTPEVG